MQRLHPLRRGGVTNTDTNASHRGHPNLAPQTPTPFNNGSHTSSFSFRPSAATCRPLPDSDLDDFEPLPDVADLFDDPPERVVRQATKRERDSGESGENSAERGSTMAPVPTTTTAKRARVSARTGPTAAQAWHELRSDTGYGQAHHTFDDNGIDFELDMFSHDDDHHTPTTATNKSLSDQTADRSYSAILNEAVQQVDDILMGGDYDTFDLRNNTSTISQAPTGFYAPQEIRDKQQGPEQRSSNESPSDASSNHNTKHKLRDQTGDYARDIGTEHPVQGSEDQPPKEDTEEVAHNEPPDPAYSFTTPTSVNELEERLHELGQLFCSTFEEIIASVRGVEDLRSSVKQAADAHFLALDRRDECIQARKAEVQAVATSIQSRGPVDFSSATLV